MKQYLILLKKDFMELYRTKKILIIAIIFIMFAMVSPIIASVAPELFKSLGGDIAINLPVPTIVDSYTQFVKNIAQICCFTLIIVFGGLIVKEKRLGLFNNLLNNRVHKRNFVLSKISAQYITVTIIYVLSCLAFSLYNYILFDAFFAEYSFVSFLAIYVYLLFVISFVNFYSVISKSNVVSIVLSFSTILLISLFDLFKFGKYLPNYLLNIAVNVFGDKTCLDYIWQNILIALFLSVLMILLSIKLCKNKD